jgi:tetratricopeptide (TPR) repeat protein
LARYWNHRAFLFSELGDWETAYQWDATGLEPSRALPAVRPPEISTLINLVLDCTALGRLDEAEAYLAESQQVLTGLPYSFHSWRWQTRIPDARARLLLARAQYEEAAKAVAELLGWAACTQARKYQARGLLLRAQIHIAQDNLTAAESAASDLRGACYLADSICYFPVRLEARRELSRLYERTGDDEQAGQFRAEAAQLVADLDRQLTHPELRHAFERGLAQDIHR